MFFIVLAIITHVARAAVPAGLYEAEVLVADTSDELRAQNLQTSSLSSWLKQWSVDESSNPS